MYFAASVAEAGRYTRQHIGQDPLLNLTRR